MSSHCPHRFPLTAIGLSPVTGFALALLATGACAIPAAAQYPGQVSSGNAPILRAVSVYEWTGDEQHPKASRLIPITIYDGQQLQDGGIYMTQPEPLALASEVEYQLKQDGKNVGLFVNESAALEQGSWVGHGNFKDLPKPKPVAPPMWKSDESDDVASDEPVLHRKAHPGESSGSSGTGASGSGSSGQASQGPAPDPDRPTLHRADNSGDSGPGDSGASNAPAPDPDRPKLSDSTDNSASGNGATGNPQTVDSDRPRLQPKNGDDDSYVTSMSSGSDPDRPQLIRGKTDYAGPAVLPTFVGLPADMNQAVAVSDARNTPEHPWNYSWPNSGDEAKYKGQLEDLARTALGLTPPAPAKPAAKKSAATKTTAGRKTRLTLPPAQLFDEHFRVFELAYGSGATMVLTAQTPGPLAQQKFVTLIAQPDL